MNSAIPLNQTAQGEQGKIMHIEGDHDLKRKLMSLGLRKGQQLSVVQQRKNGVVVLSNGSRVAVGASIAAHVFMHMLTPGDNKTTAS